jgi:hypothetical protein
VPEYYTLNRISSSLLVDYLSQTGDTRIGYIGLEVLSFDTKTKYFVERN